jgi:Cupin superfamily protein
MYLHRREDFKMTSFRLECAALKDTIRLATAFPTPFVQTSNKMQSNDDSGSGTTSHKGPFLKEASPVATKGAKRRKVKANTQHTAPSTVAHEISDPQTTTCLRFTRPPRRARSSGAPDKTKGTSSPAGSLAVESSYVLLDKLLAPLDAAVFMQRCFRQCAVHIQSDHHSNRTISKGKTSQVATSARTTTNGHGDDQTVFGWLHPTLDCDWDVLELLQQTSSENIFVWLSTSPSLPSNAVVPPPRNDASATNGSNKEDRPIPHHHRRIHSIEVADAESAYYLHQAGHALYCRAPPALERTLVSSLLADTGLGCGQYDPTGTRMTSLGRGEVEVFVSSKAGHVTGWHYDFQENFTLQVSGIKQWTIQKGLVSHPIRGCTPHYNAPGTVESQLLAARLSNPNFSFTSEPISVEATVLDSAHNAPTNSAQPNATGPVETVTLYPGDVFYFPAGMWHTVQAIEPGLSLNVSLMASNFANVTCQALQHCLLQRDEWRQCLVHNEPARINVVEHLQSLLETLPGIIRELTQEYQLAQAILPPALRCSALALTTTALGRNDTGSDDDEEEGNSGDDEEDKMVLVSAFDPPPGSPSIMKAKELERWQKSHRIVKNPLATILRENSEIRRCYEDDADNDSGHNGDDDGEIVCALNVNYAGNESNESCLRVRLLVNASALDVIEDLIRPRQGNSAAHDKERQSLSTESGVLSSDKEWLPAHLQHIDCLVHYGFLLWTDRRT